MCSGFFRGMSIGFAVGTTIGSIMPRKSFHLHRNPVSKALHTITDMADEIL